MLPAQTPVDGPEMVPGVPGLAEKYTTLRQKLVPSRQTFAGRTQIFPVTYVAEKESVMLFVLEFPVAPAGNVQM